MEWQIPSVICIARISVRVGGGSGRGEREGGAGGGSGRGEWEGGAGGGSGRGMGITLYHT